jgi:glycosyltransferase involved in cell wall biosynthesis
MLKVAVVTQYWPVREQLYRGQSAFQTLRCLKGVAEIEVFSPQASYPLGLAPRNRSWAKTDLTFKPPEIKTDYFEYFAVQGLTRYLNGEFCARALYPYIAESKPDVILSYWIYPDGYAAVKVGKKLGIPVIVTAIGTDLNRQFGAMDAYLSRYTMQQADLVVTVSESLGTRAIALGAPPQSVVPILNGCDTSIFNRRRNCEQLRQELEVRPDEKVILYVGRLDVLKGLRELASAFAQLCSTDSGASLVFVGEGPAHSELRTILSGVDNRVRFIPPCDSKTVAKWMNVASIFSIPSYAEGCPNVVVEALNCGTPVVGSNVGGIPELVKPESGILTRPRDTESLTQALQDALSRTWDNRLIADLSRRSWEDTASQLMDAFQSVVAARKALSMGAAR